MSADDDNSPRLPFGTIALALAVLAIAAFLFAGDDETHETRTDASLDEPPDDSFLEDELFDEASPELRERERPRQRLDRPFAPGGGGGRANDRGRRERRRERLLRRIDIAALGAVEPTLTPEDLLRTIRPIRHEIRRCVQEGGGRDALRASLGTRPSGRPQRRVTRFDVDADGRVDASTLSFRPALPDAMDACWRATFDELEFPDVGDGARVELRFGGGRGPRRRDAGMPMRER